jgi:hypothetical protein
MNGKRSQQAKIALFSAFAEQTDFRESAGAIKVLFLGPVVIATHPVSGSRPTLRQQIH